LQDAINKTKKLKIKRKTKVFDLLIISLIYSNIFWIFSDIPEKF